VLLGNIWEITVSTMLDDRYGRSPAVSDPRRRRVLIIAVAAVTLASVIAWLLWTDVLGLKPSVVYRDTGHSLISDSQVSVTFDLTVTEGRESACAIQALNPDFAIVGWKVFVYPASTERLRQISETITTSEFATTGLVYSCWLT
jgi:hypothetical protein